MKKIYYVLFLFFAISTFSQNPYLGIKIPEQFYNDSDAVVLKEKLSFELLEDGRVIKKVNRVERVLTYQGMDIIGDPVISFDKEKEELIIEKLRTYQKEGKIVDAKKNSFNEMTPFALEKAPDYTNIRQMVCTKVGLDIDSVVEMEYRIEEKEKRSDFFEGVLFLRENLPVIEKDVEFIVPSNMNLKVTLKNSDQFFETVNEGNKKILRAKFKNLKPIYEHLSKSELFMTPFLIYTTNGDIAYLNKKLNSYFKESLSDRSEELEQKVKALIEGEKDDIQKVKKVFEFVESKYRTINWPLVDFSYKPRKLSRIFDTRYGHALDKAILLYAMLETIGLKPEIHLYSEGIYEVLPILPLFDRVLVYVVVDGKKFYFDPTTPLEEFSTRNLKGKTLFRISEDGGGFYKVEDFSTKSSLTIKTYLEEKDEEFYGNATVKIYGAYFNHESFLKGGVDKEIEKILSNFVPMAEDFKTEILEYKEDGIYSNATFKINPKKESEKRKIFKCLLTSIPQISLLNSFKEKSDEVKILDFIGEEEFEIEIKLKEREKLFALPLELKLENDDALIFQNIKMENEILKMTIKSLFKKSTLEPKSFNKIYEAVSKLKGEAFRVIYFE